MAKLGAGFSTLGGHLVSFGVRAPEFEQKKKVLHRSSLVRFPPPPIKITPPSQERRSQEEQNKSTSGIGIVDA